MVENNLAIPKRYITDNENDSNSFLSKVVEDSLPVVNNLGGAFMRQGYTADTSPATLTDGIDLQLFKTSLNELPPLVTQGGSINVWYIVTLPDSESPIYRTVSLDFVIQMIGEMELTLSSGKKRIIKPGDLTIQRTTLNKWWNPSKTQWSRMIGVMSACEPVITEN